MQYGLFTGIDPRILGQRLQMARKDAKLPQKEVAEFLGIARSTLSNIESGERLPKEEELFEFSQLYKKSINELLRQQPSSEPLIVQFRASRRFEAKMDKDVDQKVNDFQELCNDYLYLEQLLDNKLPPTQAPIYSLEKVSPEIAGEDAAVAERNRLGLGDAPIFNLLELLDAEGLRVFQMKLPSQISGLYGYTDALGPCIAINRQHLPERKQWSLAHEYAHFLTKRHQADFSVHHAYQYVPEHEKFADAFATSFLMPASSVRRRFNERKRLRNQISPADLCVLAHFFFVSFEAMTHRLEKLKLIKSGTYEHLKKLKFKPREALSLLKLEPHTLSEDELPFRYKYLATEALYKGEISQDEYAHFLRVDIVYARHVYQKLKTQTIVANTGEDVMVEVSFDENVGA